MDLIGDLFDWVSDDKHSGGGGGGSGGGGYGGSGYGTSAHGASGHGAHGANGVGQGGMAHGGQTLHPGGISHGGPGMNTGGGGGASASGNHGGGISTIAEAVMDDEWYGHKILRPHHIFDVSKDASSSSKSGSYQVHPVGGSSPIRGPSYHSRHIQSLRGRFYRPDAFQLYLGTLQTGSVDRRHSLMAATPDCISRVQYQEGDSLLGLRADVEIFEPQHPGAVRYQVPMSYQTTNGQNQNLKGTVVIIREGVERKFRVEITRYHPVGVPTPPTMLVFYWKPSKSVPSMLGDHHNSPQDGDMKLVPADNPERVLAVWQNLSTRQTVGRLSVIEKADDPTGLLVEIVASCLAVVMAKKTSAKGFLSGITKVI